METFEGKLDFRSAHECDNSKPHKIGDVLIEDLFDKYDGKNIKITIEDITEGILKNSP